MDGEDVDAVGAAMTTDRVPKWWKRRKLIELHGWIHR